MWISLSNSTFLNLAVIAAVEIKDDQAVVTFINGNNRTIDGHDLAVLHDALQNMAVNGVSMASAEVWPFSQG